MATIYEIRLEQEDGTWHTAWRTLDANSARAVAKEQRRKATLTHGRGVQIWRNTNGHTERLPE